MFTTVEYSSAAMCNHREYFTNSWGPPQPHMRKQWKKKMTDTVGIYCIHATWREGFDMLIGHSHLSASSAPPFQCEQQTTQLAQHFVSRTLGKRSREVSLVTWKESTESDCFVIEFHQALYLSPPPPKESNKKGQKHPHSVSTVVSVICTQYPSKSFGKQDFGDKSDLQVEGWKHYD